METAKLFTTGRSQAVRLPKPYRFHGREVGIRRVGAGILLFPVDDPWSVLEQALDLFEPGIELKRDQPPPQARPEIAA